MLLLLPLLSGGMAHAQSVIDVAVFYTPQTKTDEGWTTELDAETAIQNLVTQANTAYANSGVNQTIKLVHVGEVEGYTEAERKTDLDRLKEPSDGYMDEVHTVRNRVWADIVILLRSQNGGLAFTMRTLSTAHASSAFGVSIANAGTFTHELGHIMGLHHDRYQACEHNSDNPCPTSVKPYAYGYVNQELFDPRGSTTLDPDAPETARWRTIMAYLDQCRDAGVPGNCHPALLRFSNPNQIYPDPGGDPMGVAGTQTTTNVVDGPADAVRTLNETRTTVANFRQGRAVKVSFGAATYTATEGGTAASVKVQLDAAPGRAVTIPLALDTTDAWTHDYSGVPDTVQFTATQTERTVTVTAVNDSFDENDETLTLTFGDTLPNGVTEGSQASTTVTLADNDTVEGAPSVNTISITSDPGSGGIYLAGDEIEVTVIFTKTVTVTGTPQLGLTLDGGVQQVDYQGGAGEVLVFTYTVMDGDSAANGISIAADSLTLNGGTIKDGKTGVADPDDATLTHTAVAADRNHAVDGVTPALESAVVDGTEVTLAYDEVLDEDSVPAAGAFAVTAGGETLVGKLRRGRRRGGDADAERSCRRRSSRAAGLHPGEVAAAGPVRECGGRSCQ